jgi:hypothetical protein
MLGIGIAFNAMLHRADAFGRAVATLPFRRLHLDQHRVVDIRAECAFNSFQIGFVAVAG